MAHVGSSSGPRPFLVAILATSLMTVTGCAEKEPFADIDLVGGMNILLTGQSAVEELEEAIRLTDELGAEIVVFNLQWCLDSIDSHVYECERTPDETLVVEAIALANDRGLQVRLRPLINESNVGWRGQLPPHRAWIDSYRELIVSLARFAQLHEIDAIYVVSELHTTVRDAPGRLADVVWAARSEFSGTIAVSDFIWSAHPLPDDWFISEHNPGGAGVSLVGASYYPEIVDCESDLGPQMDLFMDEVMDQTELFLEQVDEISEFGAIPTCNRRSSSWLFDDEPDERYQERFYLAILDSIRRLHIGVSLGWGLEVGHPDQDFGPFAPRATAQESLKIAWDR